MEILAQYGHVLVIVAALFGFFMAYGVGANDVANAMGTSVGSKALTLKQALIIAAIFEASGAWLAGGEVTSTIRSGIVDAEAFKQVPQLLVYGMIGSLLAAGTWLLVASHYGWPVSTTHSIVGAIIGFASVGVGMDYVHWDAVGGIVGIVGINRVTNRRHVNDVVDATLRHIHIRHHQRLRVNLVVHRAGEHEAERVRVHVGGGQDGFLKVGARAGKIDFCQRANLRQRCEVRDFGAVQVQFPQWQATQWAQVRNCRATGEIQLRQRHPLQRREISDRRIA